MSELDAILKSITNKLRDLFSRVSQLEAEPKVASGGGGGGGAPVDAEYLTLALDGTLTDERVLNVTGGVTLLDNGANSTYDVTVHDEVTLGVGSDPALALVGQELTLTSHLFLIILYSGVTATTYANTDVGMAAAIAAAGAGDTIWLPPCALANDYVIPSGVTVVGESIEDCVLSGEITLSSGSALENLSIVRSEDEVGAIYGIVEGAGAITAVIKNLAIDVANATGPAYGVFMENAGTVRAYDTEILAETGSVGYAAYVGSGSFYQYGGRANGTTALYPYYT